MSKMQRQTFIGPLLHSNENGELITINNAMILVENGKISSVTINPNYSNESVLENVTVLKTGQFLIPGFIDCHIHAVQFPNLGLGYDQELLDWLETYTFPLEKKFKDNEFAEYIFNIVVKRTLERGTTTACYFASLYEQASIILAKIAMKLGQRVFIGKVNMNNHRHDEYFESTTESIENTIHFINDIFDMNNPLVNPIITPRFALSCDMELMKKLGKLAAEKNLHIQTHISENLNEVRAVKDEYKEFSSYADVYDAASLLTNKTILAHGIYLTDSEITLIKERDAAIIHCPSSNTCLKSGLCDVQRLKASKIKIGLGTDVSGGPSPNILDVMRSALEVSCHLAALKTDYKALNYEDVFHMATLGGAKSLAIDDKVGNLVAGKEFDALVIDINNYLLDKSRNYTLQEMLQKFIYCGDDRNIAEVYVCGRKVK